MHGAKGCGQRARQAGRWPKRGEAGIAFQSGWAGTPPLAPALRILPAPAGHAAPRFGRSLPHVNALRRPSPAPRKRWAEPWHLGILPRDLPDKQPGAPSPLPRPVPIIIVQADGVRRHLASAFYFCSAGSAVLLLPYLGLFLQAQGVTLQQLGYLAALRPWLSACAAVAGPALVPVGRQRAALVSCLVTSIALRGGVYCCGNHPLLMLSALVLLDVASAPAAVLSDSVLLSASRKASGRACGEGGGGQRQGPGPLPAHDRVHTEMMMREHTWAGGERLGA